MSSTTEFHHAAAPSYRKIIDHFTPGFLLGLTATPERMDGADLLALCGDNLVYECGLVDGIRRGELVSFNYWGVPDPVDFEPIPWRNGRFDLQRLTEAVETQERAEAALGEWREHCGTRTLGFCVSIRHADFMADFFRARGIRAAAVHTGSSSAPRHEALEELSEGRLDVLFAVDLFNEGLDVPHIDTVLMLRPTESPVVFLQQLGRGLRTAEAKDSLEVIDFIGNHRSFFLKPRTLLSLGQRKIPTNAEVLEAVGSGDFGLPPGCSVAYELEAVEMLRRMAKLGRKSAIDEYCRSHYEEEGQRPSAAQTFYAGYNPASVRARNGGWFGYLEQLGLGTEAEQAVRAAVGDVLEGLESEPITKSFKLVVLRALLHDGVLREGAPIAQIADTSRKLISGDPRLLRDVTEFPDLAAVPPATWERYWKKWPIDAWAGELKGAPGRWFRQVDDRLEPTFRVPLALGDTFDAMVAEVVEYRLSRYLSGKDIQAEGGWLLKVSHSDGRPILFLQRDRNKGLPEGKAEFIANGQAYVGHFVKVAMNVAERPGQPGNALHALLRGWFGPSAGHPGTQHQVRLDNLDGALVMRPVAEEAGGTAADLIPLFRSYGIACGAFGDANWTEHTARSIEVRRSLTDPPLDPSRQFVCFARGDSMDGGADPIKHGDPLLFEWIAGGSARDYVGQRVLVEQSGGEGTAPALKILRQGHGVYHLESANPAGAAIQGESNMVVAARLLRRLDQSDINPLASRIGEVFKRQDIAPLYGKVYNPGNWGSGHVSIPPDVVLFVTLAKSEAMAWGADYVDHFENSELFVWSSQTSVGPNSKKGREILDGLETGTWIHLWARRKKEDVTFTYCGLLVPVSHAGSQPMAVSFRLLTPLSSDIWRRLNGSERPAPGARPAGKRG